MIEPGGLSLTILPVLYAEIHYRFKYFLSWLSKNEPEVILDAPFLLDYRSNLPIVILSKDADLHPVTLERAEATISVGGEQLRRVPLIRNTIRLSERWWWTVCLLDVSDLVGRFSCDVEFGLSSPEGLVFYKNDNYKGTSHSPLSIYRCTDPLPSLPGFISGETHAHSNYTSDQVEFGIPLGACKALARALGLGFFAITDHSYDLDDTVEDYLKNDPSLPKWRAFLEEADRLNAEKEDPLILKGEEVTCRNSRGRNIHTILYGDTHFFPGSGDSAERWFRTKSELTLQELLEKTSKSAGAFGAHVQEAVPFLQRILLGRGSWNLEDISSGRLDGIQFWNGSTDDGFQRGKLLWIDALLSGRRLAGIAGNDAHGNFNRFRQIDLPFVRLSDCDRQLFGRVRTAVFAERAAESEIISGLRSGKSVMTDGPLCALYSEAGEMILGSHGRRVDRVRIRAESSRDFGRLNRIILIEGRCGTGERTIYDRELSLLTFESDSLAIDPGADYIRVEVVTEKAAVDNLPHRAISNPSWQH